MYHTARAPRVRSLGIPSRDLYSAGVIVESRSGKPTSSEYVEADRQLSGERGKSGTTVRTGAEEHATLRVGASDAAHTLPTWRSRYEDLGELARGGMSSIRTVFDRVVRRRVAMKVHDRERDPSGVTHFIEEARITGQLDHPNIIPVHDVQYDEQGLPTRFTMKLVEGETLTDVIERLGSSAVSSAELERLLGIALKVCDAISFAHSRGVVHCDLKPSNVMVGSHGQVYVTDWGVAMRRSPVAMQIENRPTAPIGASMLLGTPAFMAPEQAWGRHADIDERTDVYGIGGILYSLLTLSAPHDGGSSEADLALAKRGYVRPPQDVVGARPLPPGLCRIAMRALSADPAQRHPSVELLKRDIERFLRGGGWFESIRFAAGSVIMREGDAPDAAYILMEGQCELYREVLGVKRVMRVLDTGEVFGEISIFGSSTRTASVAAATDVTVLRVTRDALERELERTEWLSAFVHALAQRFIELDRKARELEK
jgi:eukaryotic-like serine/threonine-protein kinase